MGSWLWAERSVTVPISWKFRRAVYGVAWAMENLSR